MVVEYWPGEEQRDEEGCR